LRKYAILDLNPLTKYSYEMLHQGTCCATWRYSSSVG
jgi:hypothetical protein